MAASPAPDVVADPISVMVELVAAREPGLDRTVIEATVARAAGGRAKRRRLAQALLERPGVLTDGRSPAPRGIADLLLALRQAGATGVSPPVCGTCGKQLRSLQRRDQDWYCSVCAGPTLQQCAGCGQEKVPVSVDRQGRPRCRRCPDDERDPVAVLTTIIISLEPSLPTEAVAEMVGGLFSRPAHLRRMAWALEEHPGLLTGEGAEAPVGGVLRLIDELVTAGASVITRPACPGCGRLVRLHRRIEGRWHCRNCLAKSRAQPCSRCGAVREAAIRDEHGQPLCPNCLITDPANHETCSGCGREQRVQARTPDGPLCGKCVPHKIMTCAVCGRSAACVVSQATGKPWCLACKQRWIRCSSCGTVAPLRGGTLKEPLCSTCTCPDATFWRDCPACGQPGRLHRGGRCARCTIDHRLRDLLGNQHGEIPADRQALYQVLRATERPATLTTWLTRSAAPAILQNLADQRLTHPALDELPAGKPVEHLRSILVATGTLPHRDEHMTRLERWTDRIIAERPDPEQRGLLQRYAVWHVIRRLRGRLRGADTTHDQVVAAQCNVRAATALLDGLEARGLTLTTARQGDLDAWLLTTKPSYRTNAGNFVRWAKKQKLTQLDFAATRWIGPSGVIDTETRWEQARWLLHDESLTPEDRVAGLLVLLYAQWPAAISRLTLERVERHEHDVRLRLGREPIVLPEPLADLVLQVVATRRGHAALGEQGTSPWLFPGGQPGRPISAFGLAERLRQLGIRSGRSRSAALFQLATDLPAAVLARMLGIHISVAVAWQRASSGDWMAYAAEVSRRDQDAHSMAATAEPEAEQPAKDRTARP